ncbi:EscT/YscT/HrcT family type III secretion system export apparatus protein [Erwinia sp. E602]|uniref:type III secretion system export apparatus subunit SctT n=1 Tax=Erwinia sp. E602 TaxID=2675378 RepID=UPI001BA6F56B|nr:type III secretion system export apparatus subunit SctT [Erwinia sp. E602]QUG74591.1 EscT/YscT/HrcT family type III secretion system export apparatus protein [Erwinia sp. E602]
MLFVALYLNFQHSVLIFAIAYARLAVVFYMLPALGERVLSNLIIKNSVISLVIIGLWPCFEQQIMPEQGVLIMVLKECIVGLILAMTLALPFWIAVGLGEILDNQRGATISDSIDPVNGVQASVLSGFINFAFSAIFFASDGMHLLMDVLVQSYHVFPQGGELTGFNWQHAGRMLNVLVQSSILMAAPVMIVMMVSEILLGVFARYCPQLNPFSLSMTVKSFIAFIVFLFYGFQGLSEKPLKMFSLVMFRNFFP